MAADLSRIWFRLMVRASAQPGSEGVAVSDEGSRESVEFPGQRGQGGGVVGLVGRCQPTVQGIQVR